MAEWSLEGQVADVPSETSRHQQEIVDSARATLGGPGAWRSIGHTEYLHNSRIVAGLVVDAIDAGLGVADVCACLTRLSEDLVNTSRVESITVDTLARIGRGGEALKLFSELAKVGRVPTVDCLATLATALIDAGASQQVLGVTDRVLESPDVFTHNAVADLVGGCFRAKGGASTGHIVLEVALADSTEWVQSREGHTLAIFVGAVAKHGSSSDVRRATEKSLAALGLGAAEDWVVRAHQVGGVGIQGFAAWLVRSCLEQGNRGDRKCEANADVAWQTLLDAGYKPSAEVLGAAMSLVRITDGWSGPHRFFPYGPLSARGLSRIEYCRALLKSAT